MFDRGTACIVTRHSNNLFKTRCKIGFSQNSEDAMTPTGYLWHQSCTVILYLQIVLIDGNTGSLFLQAFLTSTPQDHGFFVILLGWTSVSWKCLIKKKFNWSFKRVSFFLNFIPWKLESYHKQSLSLLCISSW